MTSLNLAPANRSTASVFGLACEPADLGQIFASQPMEKLDAGEAVFWEADPATDLVQVTEGCLRRYRVLADGRRAITGFAFPGDVLGLSVMQQYSDTAEAVTPVKVRRVSRRRFHAIVDDSARLRPQLLAKLCQEMTVAQEQMILLGQKSAEERVASFLLMLARRSADTVMPVDIVVPMSRLDMADYLGLTIETVCRVLSKLKRSGLISLKGQRVICLRNISALAEQAGETDKDPVARIPAHQNLRAVCAH